MMLKCSKTILKAVIIILIIVVLLKLSLVFLWPFLFAFILVLIMEPTVKFFKSKGFKRFYCVIITFSIYSIIIFVFGIYLWNYIGDRIISLVSNIPNIIDAFKEYPLLNTFNENYERILIEVKNIIIEYKENIFNTIISTLNGVVYLFIVIFAAILISIDLEYLSSKAYSLLGKKIYIPLKNSLFSINKLISIELKLVSITVIILTVSFFILGFNDSLSLGIICGILDLLPIVGPLIILLPLVLYLITIKQIFIAIGLIFTYILILMVRQIVEIKLLQGNLVLKPIFVIFSLYCGVIFFGTIGVLFGPLVLIMFKEIYTSLEKGNST